MQIKKKRKSNIRILSINAKGIRTKDEEKISQMIDFLSQQNIDIAMMTETNSKQITVTENITINKMKNLALPMGLANRKGVHISGTYKLHWRKIVDNDKAKMSRKLKRLSTKH